MFATADPTVAAGRELALGLLAGGILYFAPTLVAVARRRGAAPLTFYLNLFLGWTGIGWLLAWLLAFGDRRLRVDVNTSSIPPPASRSYRWQMPVVTVAPDGRQWWDGYAWRDGWEVAPIGSLRSPDGEWWFTGAEWVHFVNEEERARLSRGSDGEGAARPDLYRLGERRA